MRAIWFPNARRAPMSSMRLPSGSRKRAARTSSTIAVAASIRPLSISSAVRASTATKPAMITPV